MQQLRERSPTTKVEDDPSRNSEQPVVIHARIDAPEDTSFQPAQGMCRRRHGVPAPALLLGPAQLRRNRLIVLELLPRPLVGIAGHRREASPRISLTSLSGDEIGCPARFADRLVAIVPGCSLRFFAAHSGNRG